MSNTNHTLINCKYDPAIVHMNGKGAITVRNTALTFGSRLTAHEHSTLSIEGGSHIGIDALTGFRDSVVFTKARDWYAPTDRVPHSEKPVRVEIEGNIHTYHAAIGEPTRSGHGDDVYDTASVNLHIRGTWSMTNVHLWGNLGFDLETDKVEPVENMLNMPLATINHLKGNGTLVRSLSPVEDELFGSVEREAWLVPLAYVHGGLPVSANSVTAGSLAIAYYQLAHKERAANLPSTFQGVTPAMLEDSLNKRVLDSKKVSSEEMGKRINRIAYLGEKKLDKRFKKHGVQYARSLWS